MKHLPVIDFFYWALIISANTLGETAGDLISQTLHLGYGGATMVLFALFTMALLVSIFSQQQGPIVYWTVITLASTTGTTISDFISRSFFHVQLGFTENQGYTFGTLLLLVALMCTFLIWKHYSISTIHKNRFNKITSLLYWLAILTSSTLGTAFGDVLAHNTGLGFNGASLFLLALLAVVALLYFVTHISRKILYWAGIILTHPIGATIGDYCTKPEGFNLGNTKASILLLFILLFVIVLQLLNSPKQIQYKN